MATTRGTLLIADISGYTRFLTGVELEHSHDILAELISSVVDTLQQCLTLAKLEGDAVFCYDTRPEPDGQVLLAAIEATYFAFRKRLRGIEHMTTCPCNACGSASALDLKIVAHHGTFLIHEVAGQRELVGPDVIMIHRLLKNSIVEDTKIAAYAFLTQALLTASGLQLLDAAGFTQETDAGTIDGRVLDLTRRWEKAQEAVAVYVKPEDAFVDITCELPDTSIAVAWELVSSPIKRVEWLDSLERNTEQLSAGERRVGARNHCVHSSPLGEMDVYHEIVDWKPFRYFTEHSHGPLGETLDLFEFETLPEGGVRFTLRIGNPPGTTGANELGPIVEASMQKSVERLTELAQRRPR